MRFLVRLENTHGFAPKDTRALAKAAYEQIKILNGDVGNLRVSQAAIEFDLLVPSHKVMEVCLKELVLRLGEPLTIRKLDLPAHASTPARSVEVGILLFNEGRYWESHESLEAAWLTAIGAEREILQGIILLAASFVHLQKDESEIALSILKRANVKLPYDGVYHGIDLSMLKGQVNELLAKAHPTFLKLPFKELDL